MGRASIAVNITLTCEQTMPGKGKGKNPKAVAAKNAKEETAKKKKAVESKAQDDAAWADDGQVWKFCRDVSVVECLECATWRDVA